MNSIASGWTAPLRIRARFGKKATHSKTAQFRKLDYHITQARVQSGARVLDVGCGWGSCLKRMVEKYDVGQAVGLTLSQAQADWIASCHLPRTEVRVETWLDHAPAAALRRHHFHWGV